MKYLRLGSFASVCLALPLAIGAQTSTVNFGTTYQTIRGFGGSTAWTGVLSTAQANAAWGTTGSELGLTINRARIDPGGQNNWGTELSNAQLATARGAIEFATPWSPPASMKSNGSTTDGSLNTSSYGAYATYLESFVTYMANNGVSLYAISMQNEPNYLPSYESCGWTAQQMDTWVANNSSVLTTKLMMPESDDFDFSMSDPTLDDANAVGHVAIIAGHLYGGTIPYYANAENHGKDVWATEHYLTPSGSEPAIGDAIAAAQEFHTAMTVGQYNAYVWWWLAYSGINYELVDGNGNPTYYGYALGQFSRFVRPGSVRVAASSPANGVDVSAYKTSTGGSIVAINSNGGSENVTFSLSGLTPSTVTPWETTSAGGLKQQSAVNVSGSSFSFTLPAQSIVTLVLSGSGGGGSCSTQPSAPTGLTATSQSSSAINLSWSAVSAPANCSISGYNVYRGTASGFTPSSSNLVGTTSSTSYSNTSLNASTTYYYVVEATDAAGSSAASSQASAMTQSAGSCTSAPGAPSNLKASATSSSAISLTWSAVTAPGNCSISGYSVYGSTTSGFTPSSSNLVGTATSSSYSNTGLNASTTYYYAVEASDAAGSSAASSQVSATTQAASSGGSLNTADWYNVTTSGGFCLSDPNGSSSNGTQLQEISCGSNQYSQDWQFRTAATSGYYNAFNRYATALGWDDTGGSTSNGNKIQLYSAGPSNANQEWKAVSLGNNLYNFVNLTSGLCLDATSAQSSGVQLQQYACSSGDVYQEFKLTQEP